MPAPDKGAWCGPLPLSAYTIYSSWSGRYTMQQWMESRPELTSMSGHEFELWLGALRALLGVKKWGLDAEELITFLFSAENADDAKADAKVDAKADSDADAAKADANVDDDADADADADVDADVDVDADGETDTKAGAGANGDAAAKADARAAAPVEDPADDSAGLGWFPPRLPFLAAVSLGLWPPAEAEAPASGGDKGGDGGEAQAARGLGADETIGNGHARAARDDGETPATASPPSSPGLESCPESGAEPVVEAEEIPVEPSPVCGGRVLAEAEVVTREDEPGAAEGLAPAHERTNGVTERSDEEEPRAQPGRAEKEGWEARGEAHAQPNGSSGESMASSEGESPDLRCNPSWLDPAMAWRVMSGQPVLWELHYYAKTYNPFELEHNAAVVQELHRIARETHEQIVTRVASTNLPKLDRLQSRTLHSQPFGYRCARAGGWAGDEVAAEGGGAVDAVARHLEDDGTIPSVVSVTAAA